MAVAALLVGCGESDTSQRVVGATTNTALPAGAGTGCLTRTEPPLCYAPQQFRAAYGVQPLLNRGIDGRGRTVVLLERPLPSATFDASVIQQDLSRFDSRFGIPAVNLEVVSASPRSSPVALARPEEVLDVEVVHVIAPGARIRIMLTEGASENRGVAAEERALDEAVGKNLGDIISFSVGSDEHCTTPAKVTALHSVLRAARDRHMTVFGSSGDFGAAAEPCGLLQPAPVKGVVLPASDPLVTAVGGTRLLANPRTGRYVSETVWNSPPTPESVGREALSAASGGGFSVLFPRPAYQARVGGAEGSRGIPDVAADADPATGLSLLAYRQGQNYISPAGGTSASAPLWAALAALADQYAGRRLGFINAGLYRIGRSSYYDAAFHDITRGDNTTLLRRRRVAGYRARPGWDPVTGWGSPNAEVLVPLLARYVRLDDGRGL